MKLNAQFFAITRSEIHFVRLSSLLGFTQNTVQPATYKAILVLQLCLLYYLGKLVTLLLPLLGLLHGVALRHD